MSIIINIDVMLAKRKMSVTELSERVGITMANISILKNGKAKAIKLSTLNSICKALNCQPGDILEYVEDEGDVQGLGLQLVVAQDLQRKELDDQDQKYQHTQNRHKDHGAILNNPIGSAHFFAFPIDLTAVLGHGLSSFRKFFPIYYTKGRSKKSPSYSLLYIPTIWGGSPEIFHHGPQSAGNAFRDILQGGARIGAVHHRAVGGRQL